jgi:hypothetical protein
MSARPWNTVAKQKILFDLMGLLLKTTEEEYGRATGIFNNYLTDFTDAGKNSMDTNSLPSLEVDNDLIDDSDVLDGMEETFDPMETLILITITYRKFLLQDLESIVEFNMQHLHIDNLSKVECVNDFQFRKEDLRELFNLLCKPLNTVLLYVPGSDDMVRVKNQYAVPYETGLLMILVRLAHPYRV